MSAATETKADESIDIEVAWVGVRPEREPEKVGSSGGGGGGGSEWPERFAVSRRVVLSRTTPRALLRLVPTESRTAHCTVWHTSVGRGAETRGTVVALDSKAAYQTLAAIVRKAAANLALGAEDGGDPNGAALCAVLCVEFDD